MPEDILHTKIESQFNLQENINVWLDKVKVEHFNAETDVEEFRTQILALIEDLKLIGLDDEEAFLVASVRLNIGDDFTGDYQQENKNILQMRRSLIILGGVLVFFLFSYFIKATSKALFLAVYSISDSNGFLAVNWYERILIGWHFIFFIFLTSIFLLEERTVKFIEGIRIIPKYALFMLISAGFLELTDLCINPMIKRLIRYNPVLIDRFFYFSMFTDLSFPILICIGFIFIYYKYYCKTKI